MDEVAHRDPSPKRRRVQDENSQPNSADGKGDGGTGVQGISCDRNSSTTMARKGSEQSAVTPAEGGKEGHSPAGLTEEQRLRIERNRMLALQRKQQQVQEEQRLRIERNRMLALQRKQQRQVVEDRNPNPSVSNTTPTANSLAAPLNAATPPVTASSILAPQLPASQSVAQPSACSADLQGAAPAECAARQLDEQRAAPLPSPAIQSDLSILVAGVLEELGDTGNSDSTTSSSSDASDSSSDDGSSSSESSSEESSSSSPSTSDAEASSPTEVAKVAPTPSLTDKQRELIERNRQAAMERKRRLQEASATARAVVPAKRAAQEIPAKNADLEYTPPEERNAKQKVVAQLLCRWWYVLPEWPPKEFDYQKELARRLLRCVPIERWDIEPELDAEGLRKVYALSQFPGLYRNSAGMLLDLRPVEGRPSYDRFITKSVPELYRLLLVAYRNQLQAAKALGNLGPCHKAHVEELQKRINEVRSKAMFAMTFIKK